MTPSDLLRTIARGVEVGQSGRLHRLSRTELMNIARDYCDDNGLTYAPSDLQTFERENFLNAGTI